MPLGAFVPWWFMLRLSRFAYFYDHYSGEDLVESEVIVVNDGSGDRTAEVVAEWIQDQPNYHLISHHRNLGAGPGRNIGAKVAKGDILFFCDGDDPFFKEHIYLCFSILNHDPTANSDKLETSFQLDTTLQGMQTLTVPNLPVAGIKTGMYTKDPLHPYWKLAIENTSPLNLCIRRECHEFIEGYPEENIYRQIGCEDVSYSIWLAKFFRLFKVNLDTVEYIRYPGNNLDRQLRKFQSPPDQYQEEIPPEKRDFHTIRLKLEQDWMVYLLNKLRKIEKSPEFVSWLNWQSLAGEYMNQQDYQTAIALYEQGMAIESETIPTVKNLLAAAYNNLGSVFRSQGNIGQSAFYFKKSLELEPAFSPPDLAKVHYNVATAFKEEGNYAQALSYLEKSLQLDPGLAASLPDVSRLRYQLKLAVKGYQFSQDSFSAHLPVLENLLQRFVNLADLKLLEIGSGEGQATCWFLRSILTHPTARITCVDPFTLSSAQPALWQSLEQQFDANISRTESPEKVRKIVGSSQMVLRSLIPQSYDVVYLDGSPFASDVLEDLVLTWHLLKPNGVIVVNHTGLTPSPTDSTTSPRDAIAAFLSIFQGKLKVLYPEFPVIVEKLVD